MTAMDLNTPVKRPKGRLTTVGYLGIALGLLMAFVGAAALSGILFGMGVFFVIGSYLGARR